MSEYSRASFRRRAGISRRGLLAAGTGAGGALILAGASRRSLVGAEATPPAGHDSHPDANSAAGLLQPAQWESAELVEPEVRSSIDRELAMDLRVAYAYADIGGYRLSLRTYEGSIPGPTLRVQPGDLLRVNLINDLPRNREEMPVNTDLPHHFNATNVHVHGLHVSPSGNADNILRSMEPGQSYDVAIDIPDDHPA